MVINLKNKLWIFIVLLVIVGFGFYFFFKNDNINNYKTSKISTTKEDNNLNTELESNNIKNNINTSNTDNNSENELRIYEKSTGNSSQKSEEVISSFSTKIYTKESARQNNISITCNTLNDTIISKGSTFSFCNTVGQASSDKGYQKADIFDKSGNVKKGLGGGNCQVSTTLYNAVTKVSNLVITERHKHSNKVPYIQTGLDAAVAYGSYDLKFRNDTDFDIKIKCENTPDNVTVTLLKLI